ncbi:MAG: hypothetical protein ABSE86_19955 [Bryobacteraceae bacterium]|jgi:hypothetical protein
MLPNFLLPESIARADGMGPEIDLGSKRGKLLVLTLGITRILEQESLEVSVWGSIDGENWGSRPLATFPPKFYCGIYSILLNLVSRQEVRYLRVQWKMSKWSRQEFTPMFGFYLYSEESGARVGAAAVA